MQILKDAGLLILVIVILGSVRIQSTAEISIDFPATEAAQSFQWDPQPSLEHPALVKPLNTPTEPDGATRAVPGHSSSPKCEAPDVECDPQPRIVGPDGVKDDCVA